MYDTTFLLISYTRLSWCCISFNFLLHPQSTPVHCTHAGLHIAKTHPAVSYITEPMATGRLNVTCLLHYQAPRSSRSVLDPPPPDTIPGADGPGRSFRGSPRSPSPASRFRSAWRNSSCRNLQILPPEDGKGIGERWGEIGRIYSQVARDLLRRLLLFLLLFLTPCISRQHGEQLIRIVVIRTLYIPELGLTCDLDHYINVIQYIIAFLKYKN